MREAFEDPENRERVKLFVRDTLHFIVDISGRKDPKEEYVRDAFNRIMRFFGLAEPTGELLVNEANNYFQKYKNSQQNPFIILTNLRFTSIITLLWYK